MFLLPMATILVALWSFAHGFNKVRVSKGRVFSLSMVAAGEMAPDFELKNYNGKTFKLSNFKGKKPVVVFFYPADNTPGCTTEVS